MGKRLQTQNASGNFGQLVAATLAAAFAGLPIAVATGSIGIYAGALLAARYKGIRWYAEAMSNKKVAEAIAEPRFFTPGALNTSEKNSSLSKWYYGCCYTNVNRNRQYSYGRG